jgi:hypothetical protein
VTPPSSQWRSGCRVVRRTSGRSPRR